MFTPHESKRTFFRALAGLVVVLGGLLSILGTGGGGGGSSSVTPVTYSGVTTQATIDQNNAQTLTSAALQAGNAGTTVTTTGAVTETTRSSTKLRIIGIVGTLKDGLGRVDFTTAGAYVTGAITPYSTTIPSPYGSGNLVLSFTYDDQTGNYNGTASFSNYCDSADSCVNGDSDISGQINIYVYPPELSSMQFNFTRMDVTESGDAYAMTGNIGIYVISATSGQVTESVVIGDASGTYKIDNYSYVLTDYAGYEDVHLTAGRFYHPTYGYVDALTPASLLYNVVGSVVANWPYQGTFQIAGASNTKALLTALSDSTLVTPQWRLDVDWDGTTGWDSTSSGDWVDL